MSSSSNSSNSPSESFFELVQVKVRIDSKLSDVMVFLPARISKAALCNCVAKVATSHRIANISLNGIRIERETLILKDGDVLEPMADEVSSSSSSSSSTSSSSYMQQHGEEERSSLPITPFQSKLAQERWAPKSDLDFVVLYIHYLLTSSQWSCIVEDGQSAVKGFAAPKRPLMKKWIFEAYISADQKSKVMYKYKPPKSFQLTIACSYSNSSNESLSITFSGEKTATRTLTLTLSQIKNASNGAINEESLLSHFRELLKSYDSSFGETLVGNSAAAAISEASETSAVKAQSLQDMMHSSETRQQARISRPEQELSPPSSHPSLQRFERPTEYPTRYPQVDPNFTGVGSRDLHPYPDLQISPHNSGYFNPYPGGAGNLVGPDHPMFTGGGGGGRGGVSNPNNGIYSPFGGGNGGLPVPRFDPFGPVSGPYGPNTGLPGAPPSFLPPGVMPPPGGLFPQGGGGVNGGAKKPAPGEPNPDHFKPPSDNNSSNNNNNNNNNSNNNSMFG